MINLKDAKPVANPVEKRENCENFTYKLTELLCAVLKCKLFQWFWSLTVKEECFGLFNKSLRELFNPEDYV